MYPELIETPEAILEYPAHELAFDDVCFYRIAENLEFCMKHHHGNLDKLPEYLYVMLITLLNHGGVPYIDEISQMVDNDPEKNR